MGTFRYFIHLAYDGRDFYGWQVQPSDPSVQYELEKSLSMLLRHPVKVTGAGRTDTGVHARNYFAHFDEPVPLSYETAKDLTYRLNRVLPDSIAVYGIFPVQPTIHARFSAVFRTYQYFISRIKDPFVQEYSLRYEGPLETAAMQKAAAMVTEYSDFTCFAKAGSQTGTNKCNVIESELVISETGIIYRVKADRFLRNMVRAIVGTLMEVGKGNLDLIRYRDILEGGTRSDAGESVPAHGLFLENVEYPLGFRADFHDL
ncbi:MAG TPA: tRNA pseudouridine(38-40) synthase TruA [Lentimicrobium sp.]|nr:tRNA pseudouridine(38-40) synthase TruA [Lentimicrobium sp.]